MANEDGVIELGDDGAFDVSSPSKTVKQPVVQNIDYANFDWSASIRDDNLDILQSLKPYEYAFFKAQEKVWLIAKLPNHVQSLKIAVYETKLELLTDTTKFDIQVPSEVQILNKSIVSKHSNDFVTIMIQ
jgi:hypothetical protein